MPLLELAGAPALTPARLAKKLRRVQAGNPGVTTLAADFVHFVDLDAPLCEADLRTLGRLLQYGPRPVPGAQGAAPSALRLWVVPRLGTISPWSSKATDIAHICGLGREVRRIERGVGVHGRGRACSDEAALRRALHDRMTESVLARRRPGRRSSSPGPSRGRCGPWTCWARAGRRWCGPTGSWAWRSRPTRSTTWWTASRDLGREPHRRRADDVRAGQQRALPPQDLQRRADVIDGAAQAARSLFQMIRRTHRGQPGGRALRLPRQRRRDRGLGGGALLPRPGERRLPRATASRSTC